MLTLLACVYAGGMIGALWMDVAETLAARRGISSGVSVALVGRWCLGLARGVVRHRDIRATPPHRHEVAAGLLFHLFIGGGGVALLLPLAWWLVAASALPAAPLSYLLFGLITCLLPWLILLPSFGWGVAGRRGPAGSRPLLASPISHLPYGAGIWATLQLAAPLLPATAYLR